MGQGCSSCSVGNPCTDPKCELYGSKYLRGLLAQIRVKYDEVQEGVARDERNEIWLQEIDRKFVERTTLSTDGYKYHAENVKEYFNTPQPRMDDLESIEHRLTVCLNNHKTGDYVECQNNAHELMDLASAGRDPPLHCHEKANPIKCSFEFTTTSSNSFG